MREKKKHWPGGITNRGFTFFRMSLCGLIEQKFANAKRKVTCKTCAKILAGYQGKTK